jgi:hypothetical protein
MVPVIPAPPSMLLRPVVEVSPAVPPDIPPGLVIVPELVPEPVAS